MFEDTGLRTMAGLHGFVVDFLVSPPAGRIEEVPSAPDSSWGAVHLDHTFAWELHRRATTDRRAFAAAFAVTAEAEMEARLIFGSFDGLRPF